MWIWGRGKVGVGDIGRKERKGKLRLGCIIWEKSEKERKISLGKFSFFYYEFISYY